MPDLPTSLGQPLGRLLQASPRIAAFLDGLGFGELPTDLPAELWIARLPQATLLDVGLDREQLAGHLRLLLESAAAPPDAMQEAIHTLTIRGGHGKDGTEEPTDLVIRAGEIVCVVGPTGAGKSRLLADVECLAQGDSPSGRQVLLNDAAPTADLRFASDRKLVAQISQNMNFVVDLSVGDFLAMHAACRQVDAGSDVVERIIAVANTLAGERFGPGVSLTQLSGGQARALMIADAALLTASPIVLIDEIENAGINRRQALDLLVARDKIVLVSTHDPLLALMGQRRVVVRQGRIAEVISTSDAERQVLRRLEQVDSTLASLRDRLRRGERIEDPAEASFAWL
ncbi:ATP-binding cassette domain-containing protein [Rhodovastum atsumiense]|uniref:ATP-binding cassette domain-containing protein n=2 Tax=Rhodovastum atsumiense TaxID=504468 RepID=A0A5M6J0R8_9PROT|nr:ATP-binding cassette domain-containing protein [Rhodovastum atsumiense]